MKLQSWLDQTGTSQSALGRMLGVSQATVQKWCAELRIPRPRHMNAITKATSGAVTIADFYAGAAE